MTTTTTNEAAEKLRRMIRLNQMPMEWLDDALAAERERSDYATGFSDGRDMERGSHNPDRIIRVDEEVMRLVRERQAELQIGDSKYVSVGAALSDLLAAPEATR